MGTSHTKRRQANIITLDELVEVCKEFNGNRKHDWDVGERAGISHVHTDVLRNLLGKIQYTAMDISAETKNDIVKCYTDGMPILDIAKKHGFKNTSYIFKILKMMGCEVDRADSWSPIKISKLLSLRNSGKYTWDQIGGLMSKSRDACIYKYNHIKGTCERTQKYLFNHVRFGLVSVRYDNVNGICATCNGYMVKLKDIPSNLKEDEEISEDTWMALSFKTTN